MRRSLIWNELSEIPSKNFPESELDVFEGVIVEQDKNLPPLNQISPTALAYLGDAVYELYIRTRLLFPPKRISDYHQKVVAQVRAETQAFQLQILEPFLTQGEQEIVRRGRNASNRAPQRLSREIYRQATALETLLGYLFLTNGDRLEFLLSKLSISDSEP